jgi:transcription elongation GreA/GreB family factor
MPKPKAKKKKSAIDTLVDSLMQLREEASQRMTAEEFGEADRQVHELADRVRAHVTRQGTLRRS